MIDIKELTQHVTTADRSRYQAGRRPRAPHNDYMPITVGGRTITVNGLILSRIAKKAPTVEAEIVQREPRYDGDTKTQYALRLTQGATVWTLYDYTGAQ